MIYSPEQQYNDVSAAISAIESGAQEYQVGDQRLKRADLAVLYKERDRLRKELLTQNNGYISVATFDRR